MRGARKAPRVSAWRDKGRCPPAHRCRGCVPRVYAQTMVVTGDTQRAKCMRSANDTPQRTPRWQQVLVRKKVVASLMVQMAATEMSARQMLIEIDADAAVSRREIWIDARFMLYAARCAGAEKLA